MHDGQVWMPGFLGLFIDSLAQKCDQLVCFQHSPLENERYLMDYALRSENVRLVDIGPHTSVLSRLLAAWQKRDVFSRWQAELDVILIRASTPLLPVIASAWQKPVVLLVVSDERIGIENLPQPGWRKALMRLYGHWSHARLLNLAKRSLTFVNSRLLYSQLAGQAPNLVETRTTTLSEADFYVRSDTCATSPQHLLYAGRLTRIKGLFEILEALSILVNSDHDLVLDLVGMLDPSDPLLDELNVQAHALGIGGRIVYHGYKTAGPQLLEFYRRADIFVTASQSSSEGFPRTIWEAMASSLPVVATRVGSIPAYIQEAAVLVPPKNPQALASAIGSLLSDPALRRELICKGLALARQNTLEKRAEEMVAEIEGWLHSEKSGVFTQ